MVKLNLDKIKERQARLRGEKKSNFDNSVSKFFFPKDGVHKVRLLPWPDQDGDPFKEIWFYWNLKGTVEYKGKKLPGKAPMTLRQFGEDDPVQERISLLMSDKNAGFLAEAREVEEGTPKTEEQIAEDKNFAKEHFGSQTVYLPVIVRGMEHEGPKLWSSSAKTIYERLTTLFLKEDVGSSLLDTSEHGRDLEITIDSSKKPKASVDFVINPSFLADDEQIEKWMDEIPDPMQLMEKRKLSYQELEKRYQEWLSDRAGESEEEEDDGVDHVEEKVSEKKQEKKTTGKTKSMQDALNAMKNIAGRDDEDDDE